MLLKEKKKLTLRVNARLIDQAKNYAKKHNTSISQLVETFFLDLTNIEENEHTPFVQQLTGILPADIDAEETYHDYLVEKYG
ncbi:MAG: hypothetical protein GY796_36600 [Chloroflexi bacterium]|nr:hypothetical protein [Chloroflexota bacterium]